jgi:hypothetical protein
VTPSPELIEEILFEYKRTRSPFRVSGLVGVDVQTVWAVIEANTDRLSPFAERHGGQGRPEMMKYRVGRRRATDRQWDNDDPYIAMARRLYEAGTHTLGTGRDGAWLLLYAIPQRKVTPRPGYFRPEV